MRHVIRIGPPALRIPLLCLLFPLEYLSYLAKAALPARCGGHPNKRRFLARDFYAMPICLFWAAFDGAFVP